MGRALFLSYRCSHLPLYRRKTPLPFLTGLLLCCGDASQAAQIQRQSDSTTNSLIEQTSANQQGQEIHDIRYLDWIGLAFGAFIFTATLLVILRESARYR